MSARGLALTPVLGLLLACGKYGPPVRAGAVARPAERPSIEVPLPSVTQPEPAPAEPAAPEPEREPPPEGSP